MHYLSAQEEERYVIVPASVPLDDKGKILPEIPPNKVEARVKGKPAEVVIRGFDGRTEAEAAFLRAQKMYIDGK